MNALIYGQAGSGKTVNTTLVKSNKRNLLLCSDNSHIVLNNFKRTNLDIEIVKHWLDTDKNGTVQEHFKQQFERACESKKYDNIIVDNVSDLFDLAILENDECGREKDPRRYYQATYQALKRLARIAGQVDCNVIFTAWTDLQEINLPDGTRTVRTQPKLPNKILDNFLGLMQIVGYIQTAEVKGEKKWYYTFQGSPLLYAKDQAFNRKSCVPENLFTAEVKK